MNANLGEFAGLAYTIPIWQMALYVVCITICLFARKDRWGMILSYGFVLYWGYIANYEVFGALWSTAYATIYFVCGLFIGVLAILGLVAGVRSITTAPLGDAV